jgi:hypothetical protein
MPADASVVRVDLGRTQRREWLPSLRPRPPELGVIRVYVLRLTAYGCIFYGNNQLKWGLMGVGQAFGCSSRRSVMAAVPGELSVEFQAGPDPDAEELAQLVGRLRAVHNVTHHATRA